MLYKDLYWLIDWQLIDNSLLRFIYSIVFYITSLVLSCVLSAHNKRLLYCIVLYVIGLRWSQYSTHLTVCAAGALPFSAQSVHCSRYSQSFASYFDLVFVPLCWISRRESSGLHNCCYCADVLRVPAHLRGIYRRATIDSVGRVSHLSRRAMFTRPISCARSTVTVAATARPVCRMLCTGACNSLQTSCLQWIMTRYSL